MRLRLVASQHPKMCEAVSGLLLHALQGGMGPPTPLFLSSNVGRVLDLNCNAQMKCDSFHWPRLSILNQSLLILSSLKRAAPSP